MPGDTVVQDNLNTHVKVLSMKISKKLTPLDKLEFHYTPNMELLNIGRN
jgi:hypothetical protein